MGNDWHLWQEEKKDRKSGVLTPEVEEAFEYAGDAVPPPTDDFVREKKRSLVPNHRRTKHGSWAREPLNGFTLKQSNMARHIIGLKYSNYTLKEAFAIVARETDTKEETVRGLYYKKKKLIELAEAEHVGNAIKEYNFNKAVCSTMLSQIGPKMVQVLADVADHPDASQNVRLKAAIATLKLLGVDDSNAGGTHGKSPQVVSEALKNIKRITDGIDGGEESHIVDAEVVTEEDDCEH